MEHAWKCYFSHYRHVVFLELVMAFQLVNKFCFHGFQNVIVLTADPLLRESLSSLTLKPEDSALLIPYQRKPEII